MADALSRPVTESFVFWNPLADTVLSINDDEQYVLPDIPLPIRSTDAPQNPSDKPSERIIGEGIYDYLCAHPDTEMAPLYADILRHAYPFLISDIGSQLLLLDLRPDDLKALQGKIALLKILLYLDSDNFGLQHKLGVACFNLAVHPQSTVDIPDQLRSAREWLERARRSCPEDTGNLNYIGQVCYLAGSYHQAKLYWQNALSKMSSQDDQSQLQQRLELLKQGVVPVEPLQNQLKQMAQARRFFFSGEVERAYHIVENLVRQGELMRELPSADLCYFIGICREKMNDKAGAYEALMMAVGLDDNHDQALAALKRVTVAPQERT